MAKPNNRDKGTGQTYSNYYNVHLTLTWIYLLSKSLNHSVINHLIHLWKKMERIVQWLIDSCLEVLGFIHLCCIAKIEKSLHCVSLQKIHSWQHTSAQQIFSIHLLTNVPHFFRQVLSSYIAYICNQQGIDVLVERWVHTYEERSCSTDDMGHLNLCLVEMTHDLSLHF